MAKAKNASVSRPAAPITPAKSAARSAPSVASAPARGAAAAPKSNGATATVKSVVVPHDAVAKRAFQIWEAKGRPLGRDLENWQEAERQLRTELQKK